MTELPAFILTLCFIAAIGLALATILMPIVVIIISGRLYKAMKTLEKMEHMMRFGKQ